MKVVFLEDCGYCDGKLLRTGDVVELTDTAALDYIGLGKAEMVPEETTPKMLLAELRSRRPQEDEEVEEVKVEEVEEEVKEEEAEAEAVAEPVIETAALAPVENAAAHTKPPRGRPRK